jgi:hypothetical protein
MNRKMQSAAHLRMVLLPGSISLSTVGEVERRTDMNDARIALCVAMGVDLDDINPSSGHDMSRESYEIVRKSWVDHIAMFGYSKFYDGPRLAKVLRSWTAWNPAYTDGDDWLKVGQEGHYARESEWPCDRASCDLHDDSEDPQ